jgi:hypothetical protein
VIQVAAIALAKREQEGDCAEEGDGRLHPRSCVAGPPGPTTDPR